MIKHICDEKDCGKELTLKEIQFCNEMIGHGEYCFKHVQKYVNDNKSYVWKSAKDWEDFNAS